MGCRPLHEVAPGRVSDTLGLPAHLARPENAVRSGIAEGTSRIRSFYEAHHESYENLRLATLNGGQRCLPGGGNGESRRELSRQG